MLRVAAGTGERASFCLERGDRRAESPFLYVAGTEDASRGQARLELALVEPVERAPGDAEAARMVIDGVRTAIDGCDPDDALERLHAAYSNLSRWLLGQNRANGNRRKIFLGLTCLVRCGDDLFVAQVPPGQALIRQDGRLFAFPKLRSWSPAFQPSRTYDLPNPLGLRELTAPQAHYSRIERGDLLAVVSSSIASRLEPLEEELLDAAGIEDVIDTLADASARLGVVGGVAGIIAA
ncbi:MAG: hypothetical protein WEC79_05315 [Thermomicrobiales bacterium]